MSEIDTSLLARLKEQEQLVLEGLDYCFDALLVIHDEHLYKATHETWQSYCMDVWDFSKRTGYRRLEEARQRAIAAKVEEEPEKPAEPELMPFTPRVYEVKEGGVSQLPANGAVSIDQDDFADEEAQSMAGVLGYKDEGRDERKKSFVFVDEIQHDLANKRLTFTVVRPAVPSTGLREMRIKFVSISDRRLCEIGYVRVEEEEPLTEGEFKQEEDAFD
jgi:hypothetical protein